MVDLVNFGGPQFNPNARGNQQGTLFSNRALNRANRTGDEVGHKGFSPNRLAEVRSAIQFQTTGGDSDLTPRAAAARDAGAGHMASKVAAADVKETVARSTIPSEHLARLTAEYPQTVRLNGSLPDGTGSYSSNGDIEISPKEMDSTLIHEVGHAVDFDRYATSDVMVRNKAIPGEQSGQAHYYTDQRSEPGAMGRQSATQEGFADAYADRHARGRDGRPARNLSGYEGYHEGNWAGYGEERHFDPDDDPGGRVQAYRDARKIHGGRNLNPPPSGHRYIQRQLGDPDAPRQWGR